MARDLRSPQAPVSEPAVVAAITEISTDAGGCPDSCCSGGDTESVDTKTPRNAGGEPMQEKADDCCLSGQFCGDDPKDEVKAPGCRSSTGQSDDAEDDANAPDCCRDKVGPCCDVSCIDRLAMRECEGTAATASPDPDHQSHTCSGASDGKACSQHVLSALNRYGDTLEALGCICRALIALGQETCCDIRDRHSRARGQFPKKSSTTSLRRTSPNSYGGNSSSGSVTKRLATQSRSSLRKSSGESTRPTNKPFKDACAGSCCSTGGKPVVESPAGQCAGHCCGMAKTAITNEGTNVPSSEPCCKPPERDVVKTSGTGCIDSCCVEEQPANHQSSCAGACCSVVPGPKLEIENAPTDPITDIEKQGAGNEHVVLSISGMTCTGCETKLNRTLANVPAVKNLKTSLVLSRAEFNVDLRLSSVEEVLKHLKRTTEFKCERVRNQGSSIDLLVPNDHSKIISQPWPSGVTDIEAVDKQTVRIAFDPKIIGARDLTEKIWGPPIQLAPPPGDPSLEAGSKHVRHVGLMTLLSAVLTIPVLVMAWAPLPEREVAYSSASLALATIVQFLIAGPFYPKALKALVFSRVIEMDLLIVLSTSAAYIFSVVSFGFLIAGKPLSTGEFFETSTLLVTLIMVGRWVAALARQRAVESISIRSLQASTAVLVDKEHGTEREIDTRLLQYGDTFKVLPDTKIPTDGTVITGSSEVDESMLTGESRLVGKCPKSVVIAGSLNGPGVMTVLLNRLPSDNTINVIAAMVDEAKLSKPKLQELADRIASYFVPVVVALTVITFVIWVAVGMTVRGYNGSEATIQAISYAITVLIVSCPCAIGLAVPMVVVIASGVAAERGIIFKSADAIEVAHKMSHVVFDKTGTLTQGKLSVIAENGVTEDKLPLLLGLVGNSRHPVSIAVAAHLKRAGIVASTVPEPKSLTGRGIETFFGGQTLRAGNSRWLNLLEHEAVQPMLAQGHSVFCFTIDDSLQAVYGLEDELRPDAAGTVEALQKRGVSVHMVSGDDDGAVQALAPQIGIACDNVRSRSSPADKRDYIQTLLATSTDGKKPPVVVFCGDGTNDAVALAQATIGIHMNEGTDVAQSAADVVLMRPSLGGVLTMMDASRKSVNRINFNFAWSFVYNTFAVLLAAGAFVNVRIPPEFAGLGELVSVLPVIAAAVLMRWSTI